MIQMSFILSFVFFCPVLGTGMGKEEQVFLALLIRSDEIDSFSREWIWGVVLNYYTCVAIILTPLCFMRALFDL